MDPFETLPDIELEEMCKGWDDRTLLNTSVASSRVYQICLQERERRKKKYFEKIELIKKEADIIYDKILAERAIQLKKESNDFTIWLTMSTYESKIYVSQIVEPEEEAENVSWIVKDPEGYPLTGGCRGIYANKTQTKDIIVKALKQEYILLDDIEYL